LRIRNLFLIGLPFAALTIAGIVVTSVWVYRRVSLYQRVAATLPAELKAARQEGVPLTPADLKRPYPVPAADNAAPLYLSVLDAPVPAPDDEAAARVLSSRATEAEKTAVRTLLVRLAPQIATLERAAALPHCDFHRNWALGPDLLLKEYAPMRRYARILGAKAVLESEAGRPEEALRTIRVGARMGRHVGEDPILIAFLVRLAIEAIMDRAFRGVISRNADRPDILALARQTDVAFGPPPDLRYAMSGEVVMCRTAAEQIRQNAVGSPVTVTESASMAPRNMAGNAFEARSISFWRRTFAALKRGGDDPMATLAALTAVDAQEGAAEAAPRGKERPTYELNAILSPFFTTSPEKLAGAIAQRRLRATMIAVLEYRARNRRLPDTLLSLQPAPEIDPFVRKPLHYRREGAGFVLYSVGENLKDDRGNDKPVKKGDPKPDMVVRFPDSPPTAPK